MHYRRQYHRIVVSNQDIVDEETACQNLVTARCDLKASTLAKIRDIDLELRARRARLKRMHAKRDAAFRDE